MYDKDWEFYSPVITLKEEIPKREIDIKPSKKSSDKIENLISFCEEIYKTNPDCDLWDDYCKWIKVGFCLSYFDRKDLWYRFSKLSEKYDEDFCEKKWEELKKSTKYGNPRIIENMLKKEGYEFDPPPILNRKEMIKSR